MLRLLAKLRPASSISPMPPLPAGDGLPTVTAAVPSAPALLTCTNPPLAVVPPVYVLAPPNCMVPLALWTSATFPPMAVVVLNPVEPLTVSVDSEPELLVTAAGPNQDRDWL